MKDEEIAMQGGGYYNDNCTLQQLAIDNMFMLLEPLGIKGESVVLADYGSSEGKNTIHLLSKVIQQQSAISSATLIFNDTPYNDFCSLSSTINTSQRVLSGSQRVEIHPLMAPQSFFKQVLPCNFVDAGFCFTALHWLQRMPDLASNAVVPDSAVLAAYAHEELEAFLCARNKELKPGATLTLGIPCHGPVGVAPLLRCLEDTIRALSGTYDLNPSMVARLPLYFRTMDEILLAITTSTNCWRIVGKATASVIHPSWSPAQSDGNEVAGNAAALDKYATGATGFTMAPLSRFLLREEARHDVGGADSNGYAQNYNGAEDASAAFLDTMSRAFKQEFLRSYSHERVGFTYAYIRLEKL